MTAAARSAAAAGLVSCPSCGLLLRPAHAIAPGYCPRCSEALAWRRQDSIQRTWALIIAAAVFYVPANLLPVLTTTALGSVESDTIMGGVVYLYVSGSWPLALIVLVASVMVPLGKLVALAWLMIGIQRGAIKAHHDNARIYRLVHFVGRWSMLDVFVDAYIVSLVQLHPLMAVEPGPGVVFFMAVVVLTMFAAETFDPRLIWDAPKERRSLDG
jgi:paraquat-inducible protein A